MWWCSLSADVFIFITSLHSITSCSNKNECIFNIYYDGLQNSGTFLKSDDWSSFHMQKGRQLWYVICYKLNKTWNIIGMFFFLQFCRMFSSCWSQCAFWDVSQYHIFYPSAHRFLWCFLQHNLVMQTHSHLHFWCVLLTLRLPTWRTAFKYDYFCRLFHVSECIPVCVIIYVTKTN